MRNFPGWRQRFELDEVERFEWQHLELREMGVLLTKSRVVEVCALDQNLPGSVARLDDTLRTMRTG